MERLKQFLGRYKKLAPPDDSTRRAVVEIIQSTTGSRITKEHVQVKNGTVVVDVESGLKTQLFIHKEMILKKMKTVLGDRAPKNIR